MSAEPTLFEVIHSTRAMRRLKPDPVPKVLLDKILAAGICAPSGRNRQPWAFLVLREPAPKRFFADRYLSAMQKRFENSTLNPDDNSARARALRSTLHLAEHMHEVPVILLVCGERNWPLGVPPGWRVGRAPPSYASTLPCAQNILLAARALGLGACLTTLHQTFEIELCHYLRIPDDFGVAVAIPLGFPQGKFGPVTRRFASELTYYDTWGRKAQRKTPTGSA
ncbi:MAG: nitroreductase family protein [Gammaproteobacteria bacterium]|nr:nitroreductase family protein [Gammaproteobacteria bacterium]